MDINLFRKLFAYGTGIMTVLFGSDANVRRAVTALLVLGLIDIATGLAALFFTGEKFDYRVFGKGILKKIVYLLAVSFGYFVDKYHVFNVQNICFESAFATAFIAMESFSVVQNFAKAGLKLPLIEKYIKL
jgi:toxin secretion/phage lysis holin